MTGRVPEDLMTQDVTTVALLVDEKAALDVAVEDLLDDLRFEYVDERKARALLWRFVCEAHVRKSDLVSDFVAAHGRAPMTRTCYLPVESLRLKQEVDLGLGRLLPLEAVAPPRRHWAPTSQYPATSVAAVVARGTNYTKMALRSRAIAEHMLRRLRMALRADVWIRDEQLRFRLSSAVWFDDEAAGHTGSHDVRFDVELSDVMLARAAERPISALPAEPRTDVERRAAVAARWFERAQLESDPVIEVLFLFSAVEAILGEKSEGQKGHALAVRRALLALAAKGSFTHPARLYVLYNDVRSAAVHGESIAELSRREVDSFAWDVREAIDEFLEVTAKHGFESRKQLRRLLEEDARRDELGDWLVEEDPKLWVRYFESRAGDSDR